MDGRDDASIPRERVIAVQDDLDRAQTDWEMTVYSSTRHGFTNPDAGSYGIGNLERSRLRRKRIRSS